MKRKTPLILLCAVFLGIALYFGVRFFQAWNEYRSGEKTYEALARFVHMETSPVRAELPEDRETGPSAEADAPPAETEASDGVNWPIVDFEALQAINPDVVAWIYIEGTTINYPVVRGTDNSYYLYRLVDGTVNGAGSIFMDYRSESGLSDRHTVFYGHHMQNGSMFQPITQYKDQAFYDDHPVALIMTPTGNYTLEFFAGYVTDMNSQAWKLEFASDEEFALWLEETAARSVFTGSTEPTAQDRVVTLSTCTYEYDDARFVLVGVLR